MKLITKAIQRLKGTKQKKWKGKKWAQPATCADTKGPNMDKWVETRHLKERAMEGWWHWAVGHDSQQGLPQPTWSLSEFSHKSGFRCQDSSQKPLHWDYLGCFQIFHSELMESQDSKSSVVELGWETTQEKSHLQALSPHLHGPASRRLPTGRSLSRLWVPKAWSSLDLWASWQSFCLLLWNIWSILFKSKMHVEKCKEHKYAAE